MANNRKISYLKSVGVLLFVSSFFSASLWKASGWSLVATYTIASVVLLIAARSIDKKSITPLLLPLAIALVLIGIRFTTIGGGKSGLLQAKSYNFTGGLMTLFGGIFLGLHINNRGKTSGKK